MTATTQPRKTMQMEGNPLPVVLSYPIKADEVLYQGTLAMLDGSGRIVAGATATGCQTIGKFDNDEPVTDCTGLADGDVIGTVYPGVWKWYSGTGPDVITSADVGELAYTIDNQTVGLTDGGATRSIAGTIFGVDADGRVYVYSNLSPGVDGTALAAEIVARQDFEADIASTANGEGASLVGVEDAGSLLTAAQVEAALAEIVKKANAGLAGPITCGAILAGAVTGATLFRFVPKFAGKIVGLDASVVVAATTTGKSATLAAAISGTAVGGGTVALTQANCATLGARVSGATVTSANSFTAGQEITVAVSGSPTAFAEGEVELQLFLASA